MKNAASRNTAPRLNVMGKIAAILGVIGLSGCAGTAPTNIGYTNDRLAPCPSSPNCVCSYDSDEQHGIKALALKGSEEDTKTALLAVLDAMGAHVVLTEGAYIRSEFTSPLMGFVDDVEFYIESTGVQVRSASRLGHSDLGANRKRIESIRQAML